MKDSEADIAIGVLNKLIDQELEAVRAATRDGNTPLGGYAQTRYNAFLTAKDEIRKALADMCREMRYALTKITTNWKETRQMSDKTLEPPLPPIDTRTAAVAERLFGLKFALRKDDPKHIHDEWEHAADWIHDGYLRQAIEVLATADQAQPASADGSDYKERMRVEYRELAARAGRLRGMLQRYADGTLDFEPVCPIGLLSRQLDVMDEYANLLRRRAEIEHVDLEQQDFATE